MLPVGEPIPDEFDDKFEREIENRWFGRHFRSHLRLRHALSVYLTAHERTLSGPALRKIAARVLREREKLGKRGGKGER